MIDADVAAVRGILPKRISDIVISQRRRLRRGVQSNDLGRDGIEARGRNNVVGESHARVAAAGWRSGGWIVDAVGRHTLEVAPLHGSGWNRRNDCLPLTLARSLVIN